jgi:hypothetical protein
MRKMKSNESLVLGWNSFGVGELCHPFINEKN